MVHLRFPVVIGQIIPRDAKHLSGLTVGEVDNVMAIHSEKVKGIGFLIEAEPHFTRRRFMGKRGIKRRLADRIEPPAPARSPFP